MKNKHTHHLNLNSLKECLLIFVDAKRKPENIQLKILPDDLLEIDVGDDNI